MKYIILFLLLVCSVFANQTIDINQIDNSASDANETIEFEIDHNQTASNLSIDDNQSSDVVTNQTIDENKTQVNNTWNPFDEDYWLEYYQNTYSDSSIQFIEEPERLVYDKNDDEYVMNEQWLAYQEFVYGDSTFSISEEFVRISSTSGKVYLNSMETQSWDRTDNQCDMNTVEITYDESSGDEERPIFVFDEPRDLVNGGVIPSNAIIKRVTVNLFMYDTDVSDDYDVFVNFANDDSACDDCMDHDEAFTDSSDCQLESGKVYLDTINPSSDEWVIFDITSYYIAAYDQSNPLIVWMKDDGDKDELDDDYEGYDESTKQDTDPHLIIEWELPECTSGTCCDSNNKFMSSSVVCNQNANQTRSCPFGNALGSDVAVLKTAQYCPGNKNSCTGRLEPLSWEVVDDCNATEYCSSGTCCQTQAQTVCQDSQVYWQNSCGETEELKELCEFGCSNGACVNQCTVDSDCSNGFSCVDNLCLSKGVTNLTITLTDGTNTESVFSQVSHYLGSSVVNIRDAITSLLTTCSNPICELFFEVSFSHVGSVQLQNLSIEILEQVPNCDDGIDNDYDGQIDLADSTCHSLLDNTEVPIQEISLTPGRHLISFTVLPENKTLESVLGDNFNLVSTINVVDKGVLRQYDKNIDSKFRTLFTFDYGLSYLIYTNQSFTIRTEGSYPSTCEYQFQSGSNSIGFNGLEPQSVRSYLPGLPDELYYYYTENGEQETGFGVSDFVMNPGQGYVLLFMPQMNITANSTLCEVLSS